MNNIFTYSQDSALKAGSMDYVEFGGAYACTIKQAEYISTATGAAALEFSLETSEGLKCGHVKVYYKKSDGTENTYGTSIINAMMGLLKITALTSRNAGTQYFCPELTGKAIGLFLQKVIYTRNDQSEGFKFEIAVPFSVSQNKTLREILGNLPAEEIAKRARVYKDKRETNNRTQKGAPATTTQYPGIPDDDIPY